MRRTCPQCQQNFDTQFLCPKCGVQLLEAPGHSPVQAAVVSQAPPIEEFQSAGVARQLIAGFIVAQGLYYSVRQMGIAWDIWVHGAEQPAPAERQRCEHAAFHLGSEWQDALFGLAVIDGIVDLYEIRFFAPQHRKSACRGEVMPM